MKLSLLKAVVCGLFRCCVRVITCVPGVGEFRPRGVAIRRVAIVERCRDIGAQGEGPLASTLTDTLTVVEHCGALCHIKSVALT